MSYLPSQISEDDIEETERSYLPRYYIKQIIVDAWNNPFNKTLQMVAQEIANEQQDLVGVQVKTTWALLIKDKDYKFDLAVKKRASVYWDFQLPGQFLCIISGKHQYQEEKIEDANFVRQFFFSQKGFCAEQNLNSDPILAPRATVTRSIIRSKSVQREMEKQMEEMSQVSKGKSMSDEQAKLRVASDKSKSKQGCSCSCSIF